MRELWQYLWMAYRVAEPAGKHTNAGDAFVDLMRATQREPKDADFTGEAIAIPRKRVYEIVRKSVASPESNYFNEQKPPHKYLRELAAAGSPNDREFETRFLGEPANLRDVQSHFRSTSDIRFRGFPLIGWTSKLVWFGITPFPHLWTHAADVRACALEFPFKPLPDFLRLPWSPVHDDWSPHFEMPIQPFYPNERYAAVSKHPFLVVDPIGRPATDEEDRFRLSALERTTPAFAFNRASVGIALLSSFGRWRRIDDSDGIAVQRTTRGDGPQAAVIAADDEHVRNGLLALEALRDSQVTDALLIAPVQIAAVAERVHVMQAQSEHPLRCWYLTDELLVNRARHFPWVFFPGSSLRLHHKNLQEQLVMTCFLHAWQEILWDVHPDDLRDCWRALKLTGDFDALVGTLNRTQMIGELPRGLRRVARFSEYLRSTEQPFTNLSDRIGDWIIEKTILRPVHYRYWKWNYSEEKYEEDEIDHTGDRQWRMAMHKMAWNAIRDNEDSGQIPRPHRAVYVLNNLLDRYPNDPDALLLLGELHVSYFDGVLGLELLSRARRLCGEESGHVKDYIKAAVRRLGILGEERHTLRAVLQTYCDAVALAQLPEFKSTAEALTNEILAKRDNERVRELIRIVFHDAQTEQILRRLRNDVK